MARKYLGTLLLLLCVQASAWADDGSVAAAAGNGLPSSLNEDRSAGKLDRDLSSTDPIGEEALLKALTGALNQLSIYPNPAVLPLIKRVPHALLEAMICNNLTCGVLASYWHGQGIYVDEKLKLETSLFARSVLLHELVHYLQDTNNAWGELRDCDRWYYRELEAYALQKQFLTNVGSPVQVAYSPSGPTCDVPPQNIRTQNSFRN